MAPLLIGRVERHAAPPAAPSEGPWTLIVLAAGGLIMLSMIARWTRAYAFPRAKQEPLDKNAGRASLKEWLRKNSQENDREWSTDVDDSQELDVSDQQTR